MVDQATDPGALWFRKPRTIADIPGAGPETKRIITFFTVRLRALNSEDNSAAVLGTATHQSPMNFDQRHSSRLTLLQTAVIGRTSQPKAINTSIAAQDLVQRISLVQLPQRRPRPKHVARIKWQIKPIPSQNLFNSPADVFTT